VLHLQRLPLLRPRLSPSESCKTAAPERGSVSGMEIDLDAAAAFMTAHARVLDRRRFARLRGGDAAGLLGAVEAYRNPDGGYGWGLEPDLRSVTSQPGAALHALEAFADAAPATTPRAAELCDWLGRASLPDGGLPFALPIPDPAACAPFWVAADPSASSLQITAAVAGQAHRVAEHDAAVAAHPWLASATERCLTAIDALDDTPHALVLRFAFELLGAMGGPQADRIARLGAHIPPTGVVHVEGGLADEVMRPLDFAPLPGHPARALFARDVVDAELDRLAAGQQDDGGWTVDFAGHSPQAALEWRGYATVRAVAILLAEGRT
jgi:hypothetical protein